jgi:hypothetical protein
MSTQLSISFNAVHLYESNPVSQAILDERRDDLNEHCWEILRQVFLKGKVTTNYELEKMGLTRSPTARIADLGKYGIKISREMRAPQGSDIKVMHYWMEPKEINRVMMSLIEGLRFEKKKKAA